MKKIWDRLGIAFSSVCVIHCIFVAFLPAMLPAISAYTHSPWIHIALGIIILFTSPLAFVPGLKKHGLTWILGLASLGLVLILAGPIIEGKTSDQFSHGLSIMGSLLLVFSHVKNLQHAAKHKHKCC